MKIYVAGGMRSYRQYNFPEFDKADEMLTNLGNEVINPAQIDRDNGFDPKTLPLDHDWDIEPPGLLVKDVIKRDLLAIMDCDAIYLLKNWEKSIGARAEKAVAEWLGLIIMYQ